MSVLRLWSLKNKSYLMWVAVLLVGAVYAWQVETIWTTQDIAGQEEARIGLQGLLAGHSPDSLELTGTGVATGAAGTLYFYEHGVIGVLQLRDMPVLPTSQVYQMWCVDAAGQIDASSVFRVPVESQEFTIVDVSTRHLLGDYSRILITIEPVGGSATPSSQVVLAH